VVKDKWHDVTGDVFRLDYDEQQIPGNAHNTEIALRWFKNKQHA